MSVNCVPPFSTSPYQNGAGASAKALSTKLRLLHAVMSGDEASDRPLKSLQFAFVLKSSAASADAADSANANPTIVRINRVILMSVYFSSVFRLPGGRVRSGGHGSIKST